MRELALQKRLGHASAESARVHACLRPRRPSRVPPRARTGRRGGPTMSPREARHSPLRFACQHAGWEEYAKWVRRRLRRPTSVARVLQERARFVRAYPDLRRGSAPRSPNALAGFTATGAAASPAPPPHAGARLSHLPGHPRVRLLHWEWLIAPPRPDFWDYLDDPPLVAGVDRLVDEAFALGYRPRPRLAGRPECGRPHPPARTAPRRRGHRRSPPQRTRRRG